MFINAFRLYCFMSGLWAPYCQAWGGSCACGSSWRPSRTTCAPRSLQMSAMRSRARCPGQRAAWLVTWRGALALAPSDSGPSGTGAGRLKFNRHQRGRDAWHAQTSAGLPRAFPGAHRSTGLTGRWGRREGGGHGREVRMLEPLEVAVWPREV